MAGEEDDVGAHVLEHATERKLQDALSERDAARREGDELVARLVDVLRERDELEERLAKAEGRPPQRVRWWRRRSVAGDEKREP